MTAGRGCAPSRSSRQRRSPGRTEWDNCAVLSVPLGDGVTLLSPVGSTAPDDVTKSHFGDGRAPSCAAASPRETSGAGAVRRGQRDRGGGRCGRSSRRFAGMLLGGWVVERTGGDIPPKACAIPVVSWEGRSEPSVRCRAAFVPPRRRVEVERPPNRPVDREHPRAAAPRRRRRWCACPRRWRAGARA